MAQRDSLDDELDALAAASSNGSWPSSAEVESLLTDGYAQVLRLEVERRELLKQPNSAEAADTLTQRLLSLRDRLDETKRRFDASGKRHADRRAISDGGADDQRSA